MSMDPNGNRLGAAFAKSIHDHWMMFLVEGIVLIVLGLLALVVPPLATLGVTIFLGWLFLVSGAMGLVTTFMARHMPGFWWSLLSAALGVGAGLILLARPVTGAVSLTLVLIVFFVMEGVASIMYALEHRQQLTGRWALDAGQRHRRPRPRRHHFHRPARDRGVGAGRAGRDQHDLRRSCDGGHCAPRPQRLTPVQLIRRNALNSPGDN